MEVEGQIQIVADQHSRVGIYKTETREKVSAPQEIYTSSSCNRRGDRIN